MLKNNRIKGLIQLAFYSAESTKHLVISLICGFIFIFGFSPVYYFIPMLVIVDSILPSLANSHLDGRSNGSRMQLTMPVKRNDVVISIYACFLISILMGLGVCGLLICLGRVLHELNIVVYGSGLLTNNGTTYITQLVEQFDPKYVSFIVVTLVTGNALIVCSLYCPLAYTIFGGKELSSLPLITQILSLPIMGLVTWFGTIFELSIILLNIVVPVILLILSFVITSKIYSTIDL